MTRWILTAAALAVSGLAAAKLPPPVLDEAAKAKAAEAAAKSAWQAKLDAYQMCKVAGPHRGEVQGQPSGGGRSRPPLPVPRAPSRVPTAASLARRRHAVPGARAAPAIPPCTDPGPFAYAPPEQKPLETSGAHSPAANATSPPSVRAESAQTWPAPKPSTGPAPKESAQRRGKASPAVAHALPGWPFLGCGSLGP